MELWAHDLKKKKLKKELFLFLLGQVKVNP